MKPNVFVLSTCILACASGAALAQEHAMLDNASISVGIFSNDLSASMRVDGRTKRSGTSFDFGRDLGQGGTKSLPYIAATWRPWERHEFELSYFHDSNDRSRTLSRPIVFNDQTLLLGSSLRSKFTLDAANLTYRYWIWIGDNAAFGLSAGLQTYSFDLRLTGTVTATGPAGGVGASRTASSKASTDLPDPSIGVAYRLQMASWARLIADAGAFKATIGDVDAKLYNARVGVEFYPWEHWGVVTQYAYNKIKADVDGSRFSGRTDFRFSGFQLLIKARF